MKYDKRLLKKAINTFGSEAQTDKLIEELLELALKLQQSKFKYHENTQTFINSEIADVYIMLKQYIMMYDIKKDIQNDINNKTVYLQELIDNTK